MFGKSDSIVDDPKNIFLKQILRNIQSERIRHQNSCRCQNTFDSGSVGFKNSPLKQIRRPSMFKHGRSLALNGFPRLSLVLKSLSNT